VKKAKFQFIDAHKGRWSVSAMCRVLKVTRQGYYQWVSRSISAHDERDFEISCAMIALWEKLNSCYGAPKMMLELRKVGIRASKKRVARLMSGNGMVGTCGVGLKKPGTPKEKPETDDAEDLVKRDFEADGPNQAWFADITYVKTYQGWLYVAIVIDIWSPMVVGQAMGPKVDAALADDALRMAITRRRPSSGLIHHSDHGSQYRSLLLAKTMREHGIRPSMGSIASPCDNAPTESFMGILKRECVHRKTFETREQAQLEIFDYTETFYNKLRMHSALGFMSPMEFEEKMAKKEDAKNAVIAA
jgi:transposase InsO family protein